MEPSYELVIYLGFRSPGLLKKFTFSILNVSQTPVFTKANLQACRNQVIPQLFRQYLLYNVFQASYRTTMNVE